MIAVASGANKVAFCRRWAPMWSSIVPSSRSSTAVRAATDGHGADVIYDLLAVSRPRRRCAASLLLAVCLAVGFASGRWVQVDTVHTVRRNYSLVGVYAGGFTRQESEADHRGVARVAAQGQLVNFAHTAPFAELPDAVEAVATAPSSARR